MGANANSPIFSPGRFLEERKKIAEEKRMGL